MQSFVNVRKDLKSRVNIIPEMSIHQKNKLTIDLFQFQYKYNKTYQEYVNLIGISPTSVLKVEKIPFLPIQFFKTHLIKTGDWESESIFESSGTSGIIHSKHHVRDMEWYLSSSFKGFKRLHPDAENIAYLALLPSYLEQGKSSLVAMVSYFIMQSNQNSSGFYLYDFDKLANQLKTNEDNGIKTILFGVSYALLDFAKTFSMPLEYTIIIETGGMKGRRKEMSKKEIHQILKDSFSLDNIHSEYGMTELFSQAYSSANGIFYPTIFMDVLISELSDPFNILGNNRTGGMNIIDYTNIDSCCFIASEDMGIRFEDGSFELKGRKDVADIRGCNLMVNDILRDSE